MIYKQNLTLVRQCFYLVLLLMSGNTWATAANIDAPEGQSFDQWLAELKVEAQEKGVSVVTFDKAFQGVKPLERVIKLDRNQPEFKLTFEEYFKRVVNKRRIRKGKESLSKYHDLLKGIQEKYGVQSRFIVAFWAMETDFGRLTGGFSAIAALATLAYDGRRSEFFRGELLNALTILEQGHVTVEQMKGSWAGAMGQTQFMPSTFVSYAVDYDGDGRKDVWNSRADALASGSNYLSKMGWDGKQTWGREVRLPKNFDDALIGLEKEKPVSDWAKLGVKKLDGSALPNSNISGSIIKVDGPSNRTFLVYNNYRAIMKWNRSHHYAVSVGLLSDAIGR